MRTLLPILWVAALLTGCAFNPPEPPVPADTPRVPVNATAPLQGT
ncbi:conjugal transfer protein [Alcaligenaceae bacterium]|nr:conjugal transfer protein [Alcaligenaceae bacterium]